MDRCEITYIPVMSKDQMQEFLIALRSNNFQSYFGPGSGSGFIHDNLNNHPSHEGRFDPTEDNFQLFCYVDDHAKRLREFADSYELNGDCECKSLESCASSPQER